MRRPRCLRTKRRPVYGPRLQGRSLLLAWKKPSGRNLVPVTRAGIGDVRGCLVRRTRIPSRIAEREKQEVFPAALRCAVHAPRKPWASIELRNPCCAQALGDRPWSPVQRMRWTPVRPSNACVRPRDGFTAFRNRLGIRAPSYCGVVRYLRRIGFRSIRHRSAISRSHLYRYTGNERRKGSGSSFDSRVRCCLLGVSVSKGK